MSTLHSALRGRPAQLLEPGLPDQPPPGPGLCRLTGTPLLYTHGMDHTLGMETVKSRRSQHAEDTRTALLKAARRLFGQRGYAAVSLDEVCGRARVTKGALYHHFQNKQDLFLAVYEQLEEDFVEAGTKAVAEGADDFWAVLGAAGRGFLDVCARPGARQIILDAP